MRLIDADAYAAEMREKQDECKAWKDGLAEGTELYARAEQSFVTFAEAALTLKSQPTIDAIPVEWLRKVRKDDKLTLDDVETIDLLLAWWQQEQEAQDG